MLSEKNIVLGVSGSIAAYKAVYLARLLVDAGAQVWPILTPSGARFVGPLTFSTLTGHRAVTDMWGPAQAGEISHVELAHRADLLLLAPATADLLARLAAGRADDPLAAVALATRAPWVVAPAMESGMWLNPTTQTSVEALRGRGARFVAPSSGHLASGAQGIGRMAEPTQILEEVFRVLSPQDLAGQRVLVTAGPTREPFDPVRFVSNASSGKMGFAVARMARRRGAQVVLITGPTTLPEPDGVECEHVVTTAQLLEACRRRVEHATVLVMAAAPGDYRPAEVAPVKLKKPTGHARFQVEMEPTPDVLLQLGAREGGRVVVGFAAETDDLLAKAQAKLETKGLDLIVANDVSRPGVGFAGDDNKVEIIDRNGRRESVPLMSKERVASTILDNVVRLLAAAG